jgi:hypothetical protein
MEAKEKLWRHFAVAFITTQGLYMIPVFLTHVGVDVLHVLEEENPDGVYHAGWPSSWIVGVSEWCAFYCLTAFMCYVLYCKLRFPVFRGGYLMFYFPLTFIIADAVGDIYTAFRVADTSPEMAFAVAQVLLWLIIANLILIYLLERKRTKHRQRG